MGKGGCVGAIEEKEEKTNSLFGMQEVIARSVEGNRRMEDWTATKASHQQGPSLADCRWASFEFLTLLLKIVLHC